MVSFHRYHLSLFNAAAETNHPDESGQDLLTDCQLPTVEPAKGGQAANFKITPRS
ncbi:MAG: hypothetical protein IT258_19460 [Saprospiraceae bacterium]|nr:hypothetical protein [Saprospiraceae bacterium]